MPRDLGAADDAQRASDLLRVRRSRQCLPGTRRPDEQENRLTRTLKPPFREDAGLSRDVAAHARTRISDRLILAPIRRPGRAWRQALTGFIGFRSSPSPRPHLQPRKPDFSPELLQLRWFSSLRAYVKITSTAVAREQANPQ